MVKLSDINEGMYARIRSGFGNGPIVSGEITEVSTDIKNGYPGVCYTVLDLYGKPTDDQRWAYLDQVMVVSAVRI